jgi:hypothetical protein
MVDNLFPAAQRLRRLLSRSEPGNRAAIAEGQATLSEKDRDLTNCSFISKMFAVALS